MSHISVKKKSGSDFPKLKQERRRRRQLRLCGRQDSGSEGAGWLDTVLQCGPLIISSTVRRRDISAQITHLTVTLQCFPLIVTSDIVTNCFL